MLNKRKQPKTESRNFHTKINSLIPPTWRKPLKIILVYPKDDFYKESLGKYWVLYYIYDYITQIEILCYLNKKITLKIVAKKKLLYLYLSLSCLVSCPKSFLVA